MSSVATFSGAQLLYVSGVHFLGDNRISMEVSVMNSPYDVEIALEAVALLSRIVGPDSSNWTETERALASEAAEAWLRAESSEATLPGQMDAEQCFGTTDDLI